VQHVSDMAPSVQITANDLQICEIRRTNSISFEDGLSVITFQIFEIKLFIYANIFSYPERIADISNN